ncbi:FtsX-like permease family protein [Parafilimonas sp.]|uniref:ABC transporter permease n=1 Tax=Parafilimonas sp. TaxID=1969739 RepID=UPI0039E3DC3B
MFKNYFPAQHFVKTAWRNLIKNRMYSLINILGLTIGLCACMIVATVVIDDLSYDRQWSRGNDLYRIITIDKMGEGLYDRFASTFPGLSDKLRTDFPEAEAVAQLYNDEDRFKLNNDDPNGANISILYADTSIWQMLDIKVLAGNPRNYVAGTGNIVITEGFRKTYFPKENPVGKIIYNVPAFAAKPKPYLITGVIKDIPSNSIFRSQAIVLNESYAGFTSNNFILVKPGTDIEKFTAKVNKWYAGSVTAKTGRQFGFQPVKEVYLHSDFAQNQKVKGNIKNIYIFSGVALLLLVIACINFVNLSTARAIQRLRETGVRKILGAARRQLIFQFLTESLLFFFIAAILATLIYSVSLPLVEKYLEHSLSQTFISRYYLQAAGYAAVLAISLLTGFYPAWIMSGFKPAAALRGNLFSGGTGSRDIVRKSLVVVQFSISIIVLTDLIIVQQQVVFMKQKDIGFNKNNLLNIGSVSWDNKGQAFKNELLRQPGVECASITPWAPTSAGYMIRDIDDPNHAGNKLTVWFIEGDVDLVKTLGLHLTEGRLLDASFANDEMNQDSLTRLDSAKFIAEAGAQSSVITSYTARRLQVKNLNVPIKGALTSPVGIVADFNSESLKNPLQPTVIIAEKSPDFGGMLVRVQPGSEKQVMASINKLWRQFYPDKLLDIQWVDDMLAKQYKAESRLQQLFIFFSSLSMFLAALGIFGLIAEATAQRVKEIGIRKVLGASVNSIVRLFSLDFLKLVVIAVIIASPVAWWLMHQWLQDFAYRINISWWMFAAAGISAILIALITISFQAIKAAMANPAAALRSE